MTEQFILFYKPPCGAWYVHSHKLYPSAAAAEHAAGKFLAAGTPIAILNFNATWLDLAATTV